jgi:hypothetical protein
MVDKKKCELMKDLLIKKCELMKREMGEGIGRVP